MWARDLQTIFGLLFLILGGITLVVVVLNYLEDHLTPTVRTLDPGGQVTPALAADGDRPAGKPRRGRTLRNGSSHRERPDHRCRQPRRPTQADARHVYPRWVKAVK